MTDTIKILYAQNDFNSEAAAERHKNGALIKSNQIENDFQTYL